jgi:hypothetical protein
VDGGFPALTPPRNPFNRCRSSYGMVHNAPPRSAEELLREVSRAIQSASTRPREIEVSPALSIALGRQRPVVACGGCKNPLEVEGVPARTNPKLRVPFRLIFNDPESEISTTDPGSPDA